MKLGINGEIVNLSLQCKYFFEVGDLITFLDNGQQLKVTIPDNYSVFELLVSRNALYKTEL